MTIGRASWMATALAVILAAAVPSLLRAEEPVALKFSRAELEAKWEARLKTGPIKHAPPVHVAIEGRKPRSPGEEARESQGCR